MQRLCIPMRSAARLILAIPALSSVQAGSISAAAPSASEFEIPASCRKC